MKKLILTAIMFVTITGCSNRNMTSEDCDYMEPINRFTTKLNAVISKGFITPVTKVYEAITPRFVQTAVNDMLENLLLPYNTICSVLSWDTENAAKCLGSFIINTAFSLGILDIAKMNPRHTTLDDTFKSWEISTGGYFVIPAVGPSTIRGAFAELISLFINPIYLCTNNIKNRDRIRILHTTISVANSNLKFYKLNDNLMKNSLDYYTALKSFYLQNTQKEIDSEDNLFDQYE